MASVTFHLIHKDKVMLLCTMLRFNLALMSHFTQKCIKVNSARQKITFPALTYTLIRHILLIWTHMNHEYLLHMNCPPLRTDFYLYLKNSQFILVLSLNSLNLVSKKKKIIRIYPIVSYYLKISKSCSRWHLYNWLRSK